jgi:hypothetical protein
VGRATAAYRVIAATHPHPGAERLPSAPREHRGVASNPCILARMQDDPRGLPELDRFVDALTALLAEYKAQSGGHLDYRIFDAREEPAKTKAKELGLVSLVVGGPGVAEGYMGLAFHYGA